MGSVINRKLIPLVIASLCGTTAWSQEIAGKFKQYRDEAPQEKIYVHTDREVYLTGETLSISVYVTDASLHQQSDLSKVAYVELIDAGNTAVVQAKISLKNGRGGGSLFLPASMSSGRYTLRAYTRWMKNFDSEYFFHSQLTVLNTFVRLDPAREQKLEFTAHFFPEGGNLVSGIEARIGFKVADQYGHGLDFRGAVIDERNDTLIRFKPHKFGMGQFQLQPSHGKTYKAVIHVGKQHRIFNLPEATTAGYALTLNQNGESLSIVAKSASAADGLPVYLFAHARQIIVKAISKTFSGNSASFDLSTSDLPDGITHFTLFDGNQRPVCERLYFKRPVDKLNLSLSSSASTYSRRKEVQLRLQSSATATASISVHRVDSIGGDSQGRILEYLWLSSDLRGHIESPEFYFREGPDSQLASENLMLTQGWRRFRWSEVFGSKPAFKYVPENHGHLIEGLVRSAAGDTAANVLTYLSSPDKIINIYAARSDKNGRLIFDVRNLYGPRKIVTYNDSTYRIELLSPFSKSTPATQLQPLALPSTTAEQILERSVAMQVQHIYHEERILPVNFDSISFFGRADETYRLDDYTRFPVMEEVLREYVPGVMVRKNKNGFHFVMLNVVTKKLFAEEPAILLDGVLIPDADRIMAFDPLKVSVLEVTKKVFYNGLQRFPGIVSFTTYDGDLGGFELDKHYVTLDFEGLNLQRELYAPNYEKQAYENLPDQRSLLYWNPTLTLDAGVPTELKFYTSDVVGTYVVVVDGLGEKGNAGSVLHQITVKK